MAPKPKNTQKSYSQAMADWEAQKSFVHKTAGGVFRPSTSLTGFAAIWGWAWRFILFIIVPILTYLFLVVKYAKSKEFGKSLTEETQRYFGAGETSVRAARWDMDGNLRVGVVEVKGGPGNFFKDLTLENFESTISLFDLYKPAWTLKNADAFSAHIYLRSGLAETTAAADVRAASPLLRAAVLNPGIHPDFSQLKIESYSSKNLNLYWGASAATGGTLTRCPATLKQDGEDWILSANGGWFRHSWLRAYGVLDDPDDDTRKDGIRVLALRARIGAGKTTIEKGEFEILDQNGLATHGRGSLEATISHGVAPEIQGRIVLENVPLQTFLPADFRDHVRATVNGEIALSGSTNKAGGIIMKANLNVAGGQLTNFPIFKTLEFATGESRLSTPTIQGGVLKFQTAGTADLGGFIMESNEILLDCGTMLKLALNIRYGRSSANADLNDINSLTRFQTQTEGNFQIGLPPEIVARLNPKVQADYFAEKHEGFHWLSLAVDSLAPPGKVVGDQILKLSGK